MLCHTYSSYLITIFLVVCSRMETGCAQEGEGTYGGIVYSYFTSEIWNFDAAQAYCESYTSNSGGLAELTSEDIITFVNELITGNHNMWIGSKKISSSFTWIYSLTDTPDSSVIGAGNGKDCVYYRNSGQWKANKCTTSYGAICSRPGNTTTAEPITNVTGDSGKSRVLKFLLSQRRISGRNKRAMNGRTTVVPTFLSRPASPISPSSTQPTQNVPLRNMDEGRPRRKRDSDDEDDEDDGSGDNNDDDFPQPMFDNISIDGTSSPSTEATKELPTSELPLNLEATKELPTSDLPLGLEATKEIPTTINRDGSTPSSGQRENQQSTPSPESNVSQKSTATPGVPEPPTDEWNVSLVVGLTQNTSHFSSPVFVTGLEHWLAANDEIPDDLNQSKRLEYAKRFFEVCNNVFEVDLLALGQTDAATIFADSCSHLAQDFTSDLEIGESVNISTHYVDMYASVQQGSNFTGYTQVIEDDDDNDANEEIVIIPPDVVSDLHLSEEDTVAVSVVVYKRGHFIVDHDNQTANKSHRPAGSVVSITVTVNDNVTSVPVEFQLDNDISHLLPDELSKYEPGEATCVFWESTGDGEGEWNDFGCEVLNATKEFTLCACNHTTHFGVLLQVSKVNIPLADQLALNLITYIGAGISIACLLLTLLILNMLTALTSDRVKIHKNLVTALTVAQGLFLSIDAASRNKISCKAITLCLHYFYLSVFCWSLLEGINLYVQIVQVFSTGKTMKYIHYLLLGWGVPIPIVAISAGIRWNIYGAGQLCWLTTDGGLIWAFAGPVILVFTTNLIILCMVVRVIVKSAAAHKQENYDHVKAGVKGAFLLVPILGLGWVFGFMLLVSATLIFTYLFVITVALQGLLIFLLYCAFNAEVRAALSRKAEKRKLRRGDGLSSVPTPSSINSTQSNDTSTTFASKLIDKIKRRRSSTTAAKNSPIDTLHLMDRSESAHSTRDIILHTRNNGSIDSGYSLNVIHTPSYLPSDSMASIRTEVLQPEEFIPPNTPTYDEPHAPRIQ